MQKQTYTADSISDARKKHQEALDTLRHIEKGGKSIYRHDEALRMEHEASQELNSLLNNPAAQALAARKRSEALAAEREKVRRDEQAARAKEQEEKFKAEAKSRWLAAGGTELSFALNADSLWTDEVKRRTQEPSEVERMQQNLRSTGQYSI